MTSTAYQPANRLEYLDIAKGIGILLVVFGHNLSGFPQFTLWINSFHMPLFFIISGWLYAHKKPVACMRQWIKSKLESLIYPYCVFSVLLILWRVFLYLLLGSEPPTSFTTMLWKTFSTYGYNALWFLPALFLAEVFVHLLETKYNGKNYCKTIIYIIAVVVACLILEYRSYVSIGMAMEFALRYIARVGVAVMFCKIGMLLYTWNNSISAKSRVSILFLCFAVSVFCYRLNGQVNIAVGVAGFFPLYVLLGTCGSLAVILLCQQIRKNAILQFFGKNSLIIMCTHMDVSIEIAYILIAQLNLSWLCEKNSILAVTIELTLLSIAIPIINKYFKFFLTPKCLKLKGRSV